MVWRPKLGGPAARHRRRAAMRLSLEGVFADSAGLAAATGVTAPPIFARVDYGVIGGLHRVIPPWLTLCASAEDTPRSAMCVIVSV
jgi:hypothetical protein